jgi:flavin-dependent dehydrogenase
MYDAIVVGARCGGAATALLLARKGHRVLLVDRASFPSDTWRLHFIQPPGVASLKRWGLLDRVAATCPPIRKRMVDLGDFALTGYAWACDGVAESYSPRRFALDHILVQAAVNAGAELREGFSVQDLVWSDDRVVGVRGSTVEHARIVIGADGLHSRVARAADATAYDMRPARACYYAAYWSDVPTDGLEIYWRDCRVMFVFPTNQGRTGICVGWPQRSFEAVQRNVERSFLDALELVPELAERVRSGTREEPFVGTADLPNFSGGRSVQAGPWSAMPATTRIRIWRRGSPTPSAMPSCWPKPLIGASLARRRWRLRLQPMNNVGTQPPDRCTN